MDIDTFVKKLKDSAPLKEDLKKYKVSDAYIDEWLNSYNCRIRLEKKSAIATADIILNLLQDYDCTHVQIGLVRFLDVPIEYVDFYQIGLVDLDVLILNKITLRIEVRDHDAIHHIIWPCASNSNAFLEALLICTKYYTYKTKDLSQAESPDFILPYIEACVEKAGGEEFRNFYNMLLGYGE